MNVLTHSESLSLPLSVAISLVSLSLSPACKGSSCVEVFCIPGLKQLSSPHWLTGEVYTRLIRALGAQQLKIQARCVLQCWMSCRLSSVRHCDAGARIPNPVLSLPVVAITCRNLISKDEGRWCYFWLSRKIPQVWQKPLTSTNS